MSEIHIALTGNPNSGKTSTFNELTGASQYVGNWPGVTVERKSGRLKKEKDVIVQDLPGIYSMSPYTPEEVVARDYLINGNPEAILNIVDGTNLERNLYLTTQLLETGVPLVLAVNMMDLVEKSHKTINLQKMSYALGVPVVGMSALKNKGLKDAVEQVKKQVKLAQAEHNYPTYDDRLESALAEIRTTLGDSVTEKQARFYSVKLFERDEQIQGSLELSDKQKKDIEETIKITEKLFDDEAESIIINERYEFIDRLKALSVVDEDQFSLSASDKIDRVVTNRFLALPIFVIIMWAIYYLSIQTIGTMGTDWINDVLFGNIIPNFLSTAMANLHVAAWLQSLVLDGIIAGVGAVLGFLPQIIVLFFCLSLLEDCGYMSRVAFVMDRLFRKFGLSGKSFIPMLIATGCGVPGIMASRTIENQSDRRLTVMITTFMPCSAKLPVIALIAGAFFPASSWVAPSAYFLGIGAIVLSGIALKKTRALGGDAAPFIMELPMYHLPQPKNVLHYTYERAKSFVKKAGTIIFAASVLVWFTSNFNFRLQMVQEDNSILAAFGNIIAPIFAPLGWGNWRAAVATVTGLIAKENIIGTFGVLYGGHSSVSENGNEVWKSLQLAFTPVAAYSLLTFNLLCAPCFASIGAIYREMASAKWTFFAVGYQCALAYCVSLVVYQFGHIFFEGGHFGFGTIVTIVVLLGMIYGVVRKPARLKKTKQHLVTVQ
jgi:ferrous iron transport protein B